METPNKNGGNPAALDDILKELKGKGGTPAGTPAATSRNIDDILAGMGKGGKEPLIPRTGAKPTKPVDIDALLAGARRPAATPPPAAQATATAAQPEKPPPAAQPPAPQQAPVARQAPAAQPQAAPEKPAPPPAVEDDGFFGVENMESPENPETTFFAEEIAEAPAQAPAPTPAPQPKPKPAGRPSGATIWDINLEEGRTQAFPRSGKAAALDKVDPGKYSGDSELLSWFSDEDAQLSPKERKRLEKEARKEERLREAAQKKEDALRRKEEKRRQQQTEEEGDEEYDEHEGFMPVPGTGEEDDPDALTGGFAAFAPVYEDAGEPEEAVFYEEDEEYYEEDAEYAGDDSPEEDAFEEETYSEAPVSSPSKGGQTLGFSVEMEEEAEMAAETFGAGEPAPAEPEKPEQPTLNFAAQMDDDPQSEAEDKEPTLNFSAQTENREPTLAFSAQILGSDTKEMPALDEEDAPEFADNPDGHFDTQNYEVGAAPPPQRVPSAAFTHEFENEEAREAAPRQNERLFLDDMVDDKFKMMFETPASESTISMNAVGARGRRKKKKSRSAIITGEFAKLAELSEQAEENEEAYADDFEDYNHLQQAGEIEGDIATLCVTLNRRTIATAIIGVLLLWLSFSYTGALPMVEAVSYAANPLVFSIVYTVLLLAAIVINFTTLATGLVGLFGEPTVDSPPALACVGALLQAVVLIVQAMGDNAAAGTLFAGLAALLLAANALGKRVRAGSILRNFRQASAGFDHSAAFILDDGQELAHSLTAGLEEEDPTVLISRPTALVKGFLRQSFSQRGTDRTGRTLGWVLLGISLAAAGLTFFFAKDLFTAITAFAATLCIGAPLSSTLVSGIPSHLLQKGTARVGAVVPGWSAIEDLGQVNVVMATGRDIFPPSSVYLKGIKTFEKERVDIAILYAASVLIEGCDTLRDIFTGVIQGKNDMLYKVESLQKEPGRGFTAWVQSSRVVVGTREMLQRHAIQPPSIEIEMKYVPEGYYPVYLAVSGKLFAMFIVGYGANPEVLDTLNSLVKSGLSLLVTTDDMNITGELVEIIYNLPPGVVKVLGRKEMDMLGPITSYKPESEGVMTHIGTFASFIGGMRAAASCAAAERMSSYVQMASVFLAGLLCLLLVFSGGLSALSLGIALLYQIGWTLLISVLPFSRRY